MSFLLLLDTVAQSNLKGAMSFCQTSECSARMDVFRVWGFRFKVPHWVLPVHCVFRDLFDRLQRGVGFRVVT